MLPAHDGFDDFVYAIIQFAYVVCFSTVLPITPLIVLINQMFQIRLDAYKLCRGRRRPLSSKAGGIGVWEHVLHIVTVLAVMTNCALMATTSHLVLRIAEAVGWLAMTGIMVGIEHILLLVKYFLQVGINPFPESVRSEMKKESWKRSKRRVSGMRAKGRRRSGR